MVKVEYKKRKRNKYGAIITECDGIKFHSAKEARHYEQLKLLEKAGEIEDLELQPRFDLHVNDIGLGFVHLGFYKADFSYYDNTEKRKRIVDVKGFITPLFKWKKKHVEAQYNIEIEIV